MRFLRQYKTSSKFQCARAAAGQFLGLLCIVLTSGCSLFISSATSDLSDNLSYAIVNNDDLTMVEAGAPAYLLMIDGLLQKDPDNEKLLRTAASFYSTYAAVFVKDEARAQRLTGKALDYAFRAVCVRSPENCSLRAMSFQEFSAAISATDLKDIPAFYALGVAWAGWIQAHKDDWNAVAEISRVEVIMERVVQLKERYMDGGAHMYLGALATLLPRASGGKPEKGRRHFERAIKISDGKNLMVKVMYARQYARLVYDRNLHDRLLKEVLSADAHVPGYVLINTLAKQQAQSLLERAEEYF
jgi:hypothetical protein